MLISIPLGKKSQCDAQVLSFWIDIRVQVTAVYAISDLKLLGVSVLFRKVKWIYTGIK